MDNVPQFGFKAYHLRLQKWPQLLPSLSLLLLLLLSRFSRVQLCATP